jgi:hypothetical protein
MGAVASLALLSSPAVLAAEWSVLSSAQGRARYSQEWPDAPAVAPLVTHDTRLMGSVNAARTMENSAMHLDGLLDMPIGAQPGGRSVLGRLVLGQSLATERDNLGATLEGEADENQADQRTASDALIGRRRRNSAGFSATWQHAISPRLKTQADASTRRTDYSGLQSQAQSFRNSQASAALTYLWDELLILGLSASHSRYVQAGGDNHTTSDSLRLSASRALSERSSMSLSVGGYRTAQQSQRSSLACPLPASFCNAGLAAPVLVQQAVQTRASGSQYSLSLQSRVDDTRGYSLMASRQLSPSGFGVVQADSVSAALNQAVSPHLNLALSASQSRSRTPGSGGDARPTLSTLDATLNWNLQERLSLGAGLTVRRFAEPVAGLGSKSLQFSISLQYQPTRILATR